MVWGRTVTPIHHGRFGRVARSARPCTPARARDPVRFPSMPAGPATRRHRHPSAEVALVVEAGRATVVADEAEALVQSPGGAVVLAGVEVDVVGATLAG